MKMSSELACRLEIPFFGEALMLLPLGKTRHRALQIGSAITCGLDGECLWFTNF
jgi:hypothetical protein